MLVRGHPSASPCAPHSPCPGQTEPQASSTPDDFLARERAALGEDAHQFGNTATVAEDYDDDDDDDLLGGGGNESATNGASHIGNGNGDGDADMMGDFEDSFPSVDTQNSAVGPSGSITNLPSRAAPPSSTPAFNDDDGAEPQVLREWRESRDASLSKRDAISAEKKVSTVKQAQQSIDEFYENYNNKRDKQVAQTRTEAEEFLTKREDTTSGGTSWERIAKLVDLSGKGTGDVEGKKRMREMLVGLKGDKDAPGAGGY